MKLYVRNKRKMPHKDMYSTDILVVVNDLSTEIDVYGEIVDNVQVFSIDKSSYTGLSFHAPKNYLNKYYTFKENVTYKSLEKKFKHTFLG